MPVTAFTGEVRDSLSNLAASLNAGKDKAANDAFFLFGLDRSQVEAMYRGDWLARKIVDIVPYDMVREWREWAGDRSAVAAAEAAERRLGLRKVVQRALTLGRLYGGAAIIVGTNESRPEALAAALDPETVRPGDIRFLHVVSRWQLGSPQVNRDPLDPWFGEPTFYEIVAPERGALRLHPSRVLRFLGNELPDPTLGASAWSDSILQTLYDAIHAVALTTTGATSLMHEAKVDVVTVPNLSEHLSSAATTAQLSARFAYAAAMKSINNLLLLGDGETWNRQRIDFGGLPQMVQTFLQVAAGAADIPVTRLLGQSPAGLSATGDSDARNYYDMVSSRQEIDLRPQLDRLDRLILRSAGIDPAALTFEFRPLWQLSAAEKAGVALAKAQATQLYAGLGLWPSGTTARLVEAQLVEDGTYPNAQAIFAEVGAAVEPAPGVAPGKGAMEGARGEPPLAVADFDPNQPRDPDGRWTSGGGSAETSGTPIASVSTAVPVARPATPASAPSSGLMAGLLGVLSQLNSIGTAQAQELDPEEENRRPGESDELQPGDEILVQRFNAALQALREVDPSNQNLSRLDPPHYIPTEGAIERIEAATREALIARTCDPLNPTGQRAPPSIDSIEVPPGLTIPVSGATSTQQGKEYEEAVRKALEFDPAPDDYSLGGKMPDGVMIIDQRSGLEIALEVKYLSANEKMLRDPDRNVAFINNLDIDQARKYIEEYKGGLLWVTNDETLATKYDRMFKLAGLFGYRVVVIPSRLE